MLDKTSERADDKPRYIFKWSKLRPCLHGGGITLLEGSSLSMVFFCFLYMRGGIDLGYVGITLPVAGVTLLEETTFCLFRSCKRSRRDNISRRDEFQWFQVSFESAPNSNTLRFTIASRARKSMNKKGELFRRMLDEITAGLLQLDF